MKRNVLFPAMLGILILLIIFTGGLAAAGPVRLGQLVPQPPGGGNQVWAGCQDLRVTFGVEDGNAAVLQLLVYGPAGELVHDSGLTPGNQVNWPFAGSPEEGVYQYVLQAWDPSGRVAGFQAGQIIMDPAAGTARFSVLAYDVAGNFTVGGMLGVGTASPQRAVHIQGGNAVFRMDRPADSTAFMLVRTDLAGQPWKAFVVGVNASGPGTGEFIINDLGQAVGGQGTRRFTLGSTGDAVFAKDVTATAFYTSSSIRFKENIQPFSGALEKLLRLRPVQFTWKETGEADFGLIAEEVAPLLPEIVAFEADGKTPRAIDYSKLTTLLVEAAKLQEKEIESLAAECRTLKTKWAEQLKALEKSGREQSGR